MATDARISEYLSVAAVADYLDVSTHTVRRLVDSGELAVVRLGGRGSAIRINRRTLDAWLSDMETRSTPDAA